MPAKGKTPTQRSLDLFGESVTTLATTRRPSFPTIMMKMMKIKMIKMIKMKTLTKKMNQTRVPITSLSTRITKTTVYCDVS
jgi:hypothetical protein